MAEKSFKKCSTCIATRKIQTKTALRFHITPVRITNIKRNNGDKCWQVCGAGEGNTSLLPMGVQTGPTTTDSSVVGGVLRKSEIGLPHDPVTLLETEFIYMG